MTMKVVKLRERGIGEKLYKISAFNVYFVFNRAVINFGLYFSIKCCFLFLLFYFSRVIQHNIEYKL